MRTVIVTGGEGYIGRRTCDALVRSGFEPVSVDIAGRPNVKLDLLGAAAFAEAVSRLSPVGIIHLAAHSDVAESIRDPGKYRENVMMAEAVAAVGVPVVMASSAAVYGEGGPVPLREDRRTSPVNPYGASKVDSEAVLRSAMRLRYFNVAGGRDPNGHIVPRALSGSVRINGDGGCIRDYVHVDDVARANVLALEALLSGCPPRAVNICSGAGYSVLDVVRACERITGRTVATTFGEARPGDPRRLIGDRSLAEDVLGWAPSLGLDEIILSAAQDERVLQ